MKTTETSKTITDAIFYDSKTGETISITKLPTKGTFKVKGSLNKKDFEAECTYNENHNILIANDEHYSYIPSIDSLIEEAKDLDLVVFYNKFGKEVSNDITLATKWLKDGKKVSAVGRKITYSNHRLIETNFIKSIIKIDGSVFILTFDSVFKLL